MSKRYLEAHTFLKTLRDKGVPYKETFVNLMQYATIEEVAPVVHAHWRENLTCDTYQTNLECSYCQYDFDIDNDILDMFKYCPHCGAKMDEKEGQR